MTQSLTGLAFQVHIFILSYIKQTNNSWGVTNNKCVVPKIYGQRNLADSNFIQHITGIEGMVSHAHTGFHLIGR